ncbi:hypothetical protein OG884_01420 [Streptosporangium sp. NBC_01755]|nr:MULTISPECIES: hypothetical protein [unclassified Streptosporangium]WSA27898.1 hypothetical protein OIE13_08540 [Streptosporangium sp. NBC_01810]WSD00630.1 hypothetical protein OG884_01420 [Streptosporangium sp. NBC_01755]
MREFASSNALRSIVAAAILGCLGLTAVLPAVAAGGSPETMVLASNTPWG